MAFRTQGINVKLSDSSGTVLMDLMLARGFRARMKGLLGTNSLPENLGLLLDGRQVHTIGMRYPIDVVYLASDGTVLRVREMAPWRVGPLVPKARWIVELSSGGAKRLGIREGDTLRIGEEGR